MSSYSDAVMDWGSFLAYLLLQMEFMLAEEKGIDKTDLKRWLTTTNLCLDIIYQND
ncbi:MAG: hypothetical protein OXM61_10855 [Candidatus Poribacteria bacterium]|nr:hypothetical protein [Candidatus Poribacteria bacterium]